MFYRHHILFSTWFIFFFYCTGGPLVLHLSIRRQRQECIRDRTTTHDEGWGQTRQMQKADKTDTNFKFKGKQDRHKHTEVLILSLEQQTHAIHGRITCKQGSLEWLPHPRGPCRQPTSLMPKFRVRRARSASPWFEFPAFKKVWRFRTVDADRHILWNNLCM